MKVLVKCDKEKCKKRATKKCSACLRAFYCSKICQSTHWDTKHQYECVVGNDAQQYLQYVATNYIFGTKADYVLNLKNGTLVDRKNKETIIITQDALEKIHKTLDTSKFHKRDPEKDRPQCCDIPFVVYIYNNEYIAYPEQIPELHLVFQNTIQPTHIIHQSRMRSMTSGY